MYVSTLRTLAILFILRLPLLEGASVSSCHSDDCVRSCKFFILSRAFVNCECVQCLCFASRRVCKTLFLWLWIFCRTCKDWRLSIGPCDESWTNEVSSLGQECLGKIGLECTCSPWAGLQFIHTFAPVSARRFSLVAIPTIGYIPQFFHPLTCNCALWMLPVSMFASGTSGKAYSVWHVAWASRRACKHWRSGFETFRNEKLP